GTRGQGSLVHPDDFLDLIAGEFEAGALQQVINIERIADTSVLIAAEAGAAAMSLRVTCGRGNVREIIALNERRDLVDLDDIAVFKFNFRGIIRLPQREKVL